jgi:hypothetical protein
MNRIGAPQPPAGIVWSCGFAKAVEGERGPALATAEVPHGARRPRNREGIPGGFKNNIAMENHHF